MEAAHEHFVSSPERASVALGGADVEAIEPPDAVLYAVLDDIRNTLGVAWLDPTFRAIASDPLFVIAAWAATRPNVTKSFAESAGRLRKAALEHVECDGIREFGQKIRRFARSHSGHIGGELVRVRRSQIDGAAGSFRRCVH